MSWPGGTGSAAYAFATIGQSHDGGGAQVGPAQPARNNASGHGRPDQDGDNAQLDGLLEATDTNWSAAVNGSSVAAGLELAANFAPTTVGSDTVYDLRTSP